MVNLIGKLHFLTLFLCANKSSHITTSRYCIREPGVEWSYTQFQTHVLSTISYHMWTFTSESSSLFSYCSLAKSVRFFVTPLPAALLEFLLKLMSIESMMPSNQLILCNPVSSCPQSFTVSGSFLMSWSPRE